jgi:hypothetical protein
MLTSAQMTTIRAAIFASTDQAVIDARAGATRHDAFIETWLNGDSAQDAWMTSVDKKALFEAMDVSKFDTVAAGKRDAWRLLLDFAPIDFTRNKSRKAVEDVWGADATAILTAVVRKATRAEQALGGTDATSSTVTAWKLNWFGMVSRSEVGTILNG